MNTMHKQKVNIIVLVLLVLHLMMPTSIHSTPISMPIMRSFQVIKDILSDHRVQMGIAAYLLIVAAVARYSASAIKKKQSEDNPQAQQQPLPQARSSSSSSSSSSQPLKIEDEINNLSALFTKRQKNFENDFKTQSILYSSKPQLQNIQKVESELINTMQQINVYLHRSTKTLVLTSNYNQLIDAILGLTGTLLNRANNIARNNLSASKPTINTPLTLKEHHDHNQQYSNWVDITNDQAKLLLMTYQWRIDKVFMTALKLVNQEAHSLPTTYAHLMNIKINRILDTEIDNVMLQNNLYDKTNLSKAFNYLQHINKKANERLTIAQQELVTIQQLHQPPRRPKTMHGSRSSSPSSPTARFTYQKANSH